MKKKSALEMVRRELKRTEDAHSSMFTPHEGWAVIREELDELWDEVRSGDGLTHRGATEAVQVAAAALRYLTDLIDEEIAEQHESKAEAWARQQDDQQSGTTITHHISPFGGFGGGGYSG